VPGYGACPRASGAGARAPATEGGSVPTSQPILPAHHMAVPPLEEGLWLERQGALAQALRRYQDAAQSRDPREQAEALRRQADVHRMLGEWDLAVQCVKESQRIAIDHPHLRAQALNAEGVIRSLREELDEAEACWEEALALSEQPKLSGLCLQNLGAQTARRNNLAAAVEFFERSYRMFEQAGFAKGKALVLNNLGCVRMDQGAPEIAEGIFTHAESAAKEAGEQNLRALTVMNRGESRLRLGRMGESLKDLGEARIQFHLSKDRYHLMVVNGLLGDWFVGQEQDKANQYYGNAAALAGKLGLQDRCQEYTARITAPPTTVMTPPNA
jgi:tetratricopeptide (TPR) repeat protein